MNRKIIIGIIVFVILAGGILFYFFLPSVPSFPDKKSLFGNLPIIGGGLTTGTGTTPSDTTDSSRESAKKERPVRQIIDREITIPALGTDKNSILYVLRENGHIFSSDLDGYNERSVINLTVLNVFDGAWATKKDRVIMRYFENDLVKTFVNGVATGTISRFLPPETASADWSPDGTSLAYLVRKNSDTALVIADAGNKNPRTVWTTPIPDFVVRWASKNTILLVSKPSGLAPSLVIRFDVLSRRADVLFSGIHGVVLMPAPDNSGFIFSQSANDGSAGGLSLYTFKDQRAAPLNITTIAEKCAFSSDAKIIFCGVPKGTPRSPQPDEWYKGTVSFSDAIVKIDLASGEMTTLVEQAADIDMINPFASPDGKYLFFVDKKTSTLWRVTLEDGD